MQGNPQTDSSTGEQLDQHANAQPNALEGEHGLSQVPASASEGADQLEQDATGARAALQSDALEPEPLGSQLVAPEQAPTAGGQYASGSKKGLLVALVALVALLALAGAAYAALGSRPQEPVQETPAQSSQEPEASSASSAAGSAGSSASSASAQSSQEAPAGPDMQAYDFTVEDAQGDQVSLSSMMGKPTFVGFWATWCPNCIKEASEIQSLYDHFGDKVNFMMVDVTDGMRETKEAAATWIADNGFTYPVYYDTNDLEAAYTYQANLLPTTVIFDSNGMVVDYFMGAKPEEELVQALDELL